MKLPRYLIALFSLGLMWPMAHANELSKVQKEIKQQQVKLEEQRKKRNALQSTLKNQEFEMNSVINKLKETEMSIGEIRKAIASTEKEIKQLEKQEKAQKEKLKEQLDSAYRSGIHPSVLERLLSSEAKDADRMSAYYEHLNGIRIDAIQELRSTQEQLKIQRDTLKSQQKGQQTQLSAQKKQEKDLKKVQQERESTIRSIDKTLEKESDRLDALKNNEQALRNRILQAEQEAEQATKREEKQQLEKLEQKKNSEEKRTATEQEKQQVRQQVREKNNSGNGLGSAAKQYAMPASGKVVTSFGGSWHGIVIQAGAGSPVRAIAGGRVAMADWLQGYGQIVAIDHGNGDMSIYGYNQSLSVRYGDRVKAGQTIAAVGNSGGQTRSGLYFEIRRKGAAQNPMKWVR